MDRRFHGPVTELPALLLRGGPGGQPLAAGPPAFWLIARGGELEVLPGPTGDRGWLAIVRNRLVGTTPYDRVVHLARSLRPASPDCFGGLFAGSFAWEWANTLWTEGRVRSSPPGTPPSWDFVLGFFDHVRIGVPGADLAHSAAMPDGSTPGAPPWPFDPSDPPPYTTPCRTHLRGPDPIAYERAIAVLREAIAAGEYYQANLCFRFHGPAERGHAEAAFRHLAFHNPAPWAAWLASPAGTLVSASPETFLTVDHRRVRSGPIKGTRPRGQDPADDRRQREALRDSDKDAAELAMIVDLMRNDLARRCVPGTVSRTVEPRIEAHPTVWHRVADIEGQLLDDADIWDLLRDAFPPGSCVGAPKVAALSALQALEHDARGPYTGAIGWIDLRGEAGLSVAIRTLLFEGDQLSFGVGGGIVWDSVAAEEWRECWIKARALRRAVGAEDDAADPYADPMLTLPR